MEVHNPFQEIVERLTNIEDYLLNFSHSPKQQSPQDERLTRREVCCLYKISLPTVHKAMREGLPFEKLGRKTLFRREQVDSYFRNKKG